MNQWKIWIGWIVACSLYPVALAIASAAFSKPIQAVHPYSTALSYAMVVIIILALVLPPVIQWRVLRRFADQLRLWKWIGALLIAGVVWTLGKLYVNSPGNIDRDFLIAAAEARQGYASTASALIRLPWLKLLLVSSGVAASMALVPALILQRAIGVRWGLLVVCAIVGNCSANVFEQGLVFFHLHDPNHLLNGLNITERITMLIVFAEIGAVWGATSALALNLFARQHAAKVEPTWPSAGRMAIATAGTIVGALSVRYFVDQQGFRADIPAIQLAFTKSQPTDISTGREVLRLSSIAEFDAPRPPAYPVSHLALDGQSFFVLSEQHALKRIDLATGKDLGQLAGALKPSEAFRIAWSPSGKYFAMLTDADAPNTDKVASSTNTLTLRLFQLPTYKVVREIEHVFKDCRSPYESPLLFDTQDNLWIRCSQRLTQPDPKSVVAFHLSVPSLEINETRLYGTDSQYGQARGMGRVGEHILFWQMRPTDSSSIYVQNLTQHRLQSVLNDLTDPNVAGGLLLQTVDLVDSGLIARFNGTSSEVANPQEVDQFRRIHSFSRIITFDALTGHQLKVLDEANRRIMSELSLDNPKGTLRVTGSWKDNDKTGEMTVKDLATREELQQIVTHAQRPVAFSSDGHWLVTHAIYDHKLRIYSVNR